MRTFLFWIAATTFAIGQVKYEVQEISGTVISIRSGYSFAYEVIELKVSDETFYFGINPVYGKSIISKIKVNQPLTLKASVNLTLRENLKKNGRDFHSRYYYYFTDKIVEIKMDNEWVATPFDDKSRTVIRENWRVLLEEKVLGEYVLDGKKMGLIFRDGIVAFSAMILSDFKTMAKTNVGDKVSFMGHKGVVREGNLYPIDGIKEVYSFLPLTKEVGEIQSFIYKQNFARIGLVVNQKRLSFPADLAREIDRFAKGEKVTIYHEGHHDQRSNSLPTIHALIQGQDTILIPRMYYGDPDGKHEHKEAELDGKISKVNRSDKGRIISLIIGNDCYVEVDAKMAEQLGSYLSRGKQLKVLGDERIKKKGEIYEQNFRIITPRKVVADGKEFILKK